MAGGPARVKRWSSRTPQKTNATLFGTRRGSGTTGEDVEITGMTERMSMPLVEGEICETDEEGERGGRGEEEEKVEEGGVDQQRWSP